jgi:hypothetical protein
MLSPALNSPRNNDRQSCPRIRGFDRDFAPSALVRDDKLVRVP